MSISLSQRNEILARRLSELNINGELHENDEKELAALALQLGFKETYAADFLRKKFLEEFNPIKQQIEKVHLLTDEDLTLIERIKKKYNIRLTMEGNIGIFRSAYLIETKHQLPEPIATDLMLESGELAYHSIQTSWAQITSLTKIKLISVGILYVTSERLFFCGEIKNISLNLEKIVSCHFYSDYLKIDKTAGKSELFAMTFPEARYIIALIRALK